MSANSSHHELTNPALLHWESSPSGRGSIDIIWSCAVTLFLCAWYSLCLNVPALNETKKRYVLREKMLMATFCFLGPELLFAIAVGQWQSAQRSVRNFHASGYQNWTIRHAFFANMGGFILRTRDFKPFPLDAEQLHYLVINNYLPYPQIDKETINDKNKVDSVARVITIVQVLWFVLNSIGRLVQHLELTTGELSTLGFILCTLGSTFCWAKKPSDVYRAIILETEVTMVHILCSAGDKARAPYRNSPLDFVNREEWLWNRCWTYWLNMLGAMHIRTFSRTLKVRPINRIPNDRFQKIDEAGLFLVFLLSLCYGALFVCGWNFSFPTKIERDLWRIASVTNIGIIFISYFFETLFLSTLPVLRGEEDTSRSLAKQDVESGPGKRCLSTSFPRRQAKSLAEKLRNNSPDNDPQLAMQLRTILPLLSASMLYFLARAQSTGPRFGLTYERKIPLIEWLPYVTVTARKPDEEGEDVIGVAVEGEKSK